MFTFPLVLVTGLVQLAASVEGGHHSGHGADNSPLTDKLFVFPWQIYPDMVVFDWLIKLADKDRMVGCDLSYGLEPSGNTEYTSDKAAAGNTSIVENFLPAYRTFKIYPLRSNSTYWLYMTCKDKEGGWHVSDTINFQTSVAIMYSDQPAAIQADPPQSGLRERLNRGMLSVRPTSKFSPHMLMGLSCVVLSVLVLTVSSALLAKRYKQGKTYQIEIEKEIKAFEEGENAVCEEILIQDNINISSGEEYVDIDSFNEDNLTLNSDDSPDHDNFEEEDEGSKF